jgi:hypothetical protein
MGYLNVFINIFGIIGGLFPRCKQISPWAKLEMQVELFGIFYCL